MGKPFESLLQKLSKLQEIHGLYLKAERELESHIGVPTCIPNCGLCCQNNTVLVWGIEVEAIASYLLGQGKTLDSIMDMCEYWLTNRKGKIRTLSYYQQNLDKLMERARELFHSSCPLLTKDKKCLIYQMRPLACRAYGVTNAQTNCPRPYGLGESGKTRAYNQGMATIINEKLNQLLKDCASDSFAATVGFLPTLMMMRLRSQRFVSLVDSGKVDPVKLARNFIHSPVALFQEQFVNLNLAGDRALQEIERTGINTGPITVKINN